MQCNEMQFCRRRHNALNCEAERPSPSWGVMAHPRGLLGAPRCPKVPPSDPWNPNISQNKSNGRSTLFNAGRNQTDERWRNMLAAAAGFDLRLFTSLTDCHELDTLPCRFQDKKRRGKKKKKGGKKDIDIYISNWLPRARYCTGTPPQRTLFLNYIFVPELWKRKRRRKRGRKERYTIQWQHLTST